ncbi:MAG TPA: SDR family oxidoreductase [Alcanivorax sp.]|nr:SDR family oxidoreductase [Alcanivorax sp.]
MPRLCFHSRAPRLRFTDQTRIKGQSPAPCNPGVRSRRLFVANGGGRDFMQAVGYNTSKGAVVTFTRALAAEWGAYNITVNAIGPGVFPSKMSRYLTDRHGVKALAARVPLNRVGDEEDLKGTVLLFASDAGKHITGQFLVVDGGASAMIAG